jgi:hypothetical protein
MLECRSPSETCLAVAEVGTKPLTESYRENDMTGVLIWS